MSYTIVAVDGVEVSGGRLPVSVPPPSAPEDKTAVRQTGYGDVSGSSYIDTTYVIPNGETFTLTYFASGGPPGTSDYSAIELWYCPDGIVNGNAELLDVGFTPNDTRSQLDTDFIGNGTRSIVLRRKRLNAGTLLIYGRFEGYY